MSISFRRDDAGVDQSTVGLKPALIVRPQTNLFTDGRFID